MIGWLTMLAIGAATMAALILLRVGRQLWTLAGAAMMLGAAGYAWQGQPALPGVPREIARQVREPVPAEDDLRDAIWGRFGYGNAYAVAADGLARAGATRSAANAALGGLKGAPADAQLWTRLGTAIVAHDGGKVVSPAARLSFARGAAVAPDHPGPYFYLGIALIQTGDLPGARRAWQAALRRTPTDISYRRDIEMRVALLDRYIAMRAEEPATPAR